MSALAVGSRTEIGVKDTTVSTTIPDNDTARLMYYLHCLCTVLDLNSEVGLNRLKAYHNYNTLTEEERLALLALCLALNPIELEGKCIFAVRNVSGRYSNQFLELSASQTNFVASRNVMVAGRSRAVTKIMLYTRQWIQQYYLGPLERVADRSGGGRRQLTYHQSPAATDLCCCTIL